MTQPSVLTLAQVEMGAVALLLHRQRDQYHEVVRCIPDHLIPLETSWPDKGELTLDQLCTDHVAISQAIPSALSLALTEEISGVYRAQVSPDGWYFTAVWAGSEPSTRMIHSVQTKLDPGARVVLANEIEQALATDSLDIIIAGFKSLDQGVVVVNDTTDRVIANTEAVKQLSLPSSRVSSKEFSTSMRRLQESAVNSDQVMETTSSITALQRNSTSEWIWIFEEPSLHLKVTSRPLISPGSSGRIWVIEDVTREIQMIAEMDRMATTLRLTSDGMLDPQIFLRPLLEEGQIVDFIYEEVNRAYSVYLRIPREHLLGTRLKATMPNIEDHGLFDRFVAAMETGIPIDLEDFSFSNTILGIDAVYDIKGMRIGEGLSLTWRDKTERWRLTQQREKLEQQLERFLSTETVSAIRLDSDGKVKWASNSVSRILGIPRETLMDMDIRSTLLADDIIHTFETIRKVRLTHQPEQLVVKVRSANDGYRTLEGRMYLSDDESEDLEVVLADVSERVESDRMRAIVTSVASHEIRTPLAFIYASLTMLRDGTVDATSPVGKQLIRRMVNSTERLTRLSNSLLQLQRLELTSSLNNFEPILVGATVRDAAMSVSMERDTHLVIDDASESAELFVDGDLLTQSVINLVDNAIKYSPDNGRIDVLLRMLPDGLEVTVRDRGEGIPPQKRESIFEAFTQIAPEHRHQGVGLGLAIVRRIAEMHHGSITVNTPIDGRGSEFVLILRETKY